VSLNLAHPVYCVNSYKLTVYIVYCTCCRASRVQQECQTVNRVVHPEGMIWYVFTVVSWLAGICCLSQISGMATLPTVGAVPSHPYYCRLGDLLCFVVICLLTVCLICLCTICSFSTLILLVGSLTCKNRLPYNLYCVGGYIKPQSIKSRISWCYFFSCSCKRTELYL